MRSLLLIALFIISSPLLFAQSQISGKVIAGESGKPLPFALVSTASDTTLTNISGEFKLNTLEIPEKIIISYRNYRPIEFYPDTFQDYVIIKLDVLDPALYDEGSNGDALQIITEALKKKDLNDPEKNLQSFAYKSYNKLIIDKQRDVQGNIISPYEFDPVANDINSRSFLSEKVSHHLFKAPGLKQEEVTGLSTAGFEDPVYEVLELNIEPRSIYANDYYFFETSYAGPLGRKATANYNYKILDTVTTNGRAGYMIYFQPKRPNKVAGWEGVLFLDTITLAVQKAKMQLAAAINAEIDQDYTYLPDEDLWFPVKQSVKLKPGTEEKDISIFGGSISLGTVYRKPSILNTVLNTGQIEKDLILTSTTTNFDIGVNVPVETDIYTPSRKVLDEADQRSVNFWEGNRQEPFTKEDELTSLRVNRIIITRDILRKREILDAISIGYYPVGFWNFDLSNFIKYNTYEGFRVGLGGETNQKFSNTFRLNGYLVYGIKDEAFKYGLGSGVLLNRPTGTWFNVEYNQDIREVASQTYLKGVNEFSILEPRFANINFHYFFKNIQSGIEHRITPRLDTELVLGRSDISQTREYSFLHEGQSYSNYTITEAKFGFLWRPFAKFLSTPNSHTLYEKGYPVITGQISQAIAGALGGDFNFTRLSLKTEYQIDRQDKSVTQVTLEGNYGVGDLPLTHAFHALPNNPNKPEILSRFSVAGQISFETMYFNEFFSDRQATLHIRHQLRPINITSNIRPELVLISRHAIGDFRNPELHQNIEFNTLTHGYSEAGLELNKIFFGIGISTAYRYGAYHLPTFKENFSLKFTFQLKI